LWCLSINDDAGETRVGWTTLPERVDRYAC
jgi:hypothetical protein